MAASSGLVLLLTSTALVCGVTFELTHQRLGNTFYLTCAVQNGSTVPGLMRFWLNNTGMDIFDIFEDAVQVSSNIINFKLVPQYEGTFYCGEVDGVGKSNGLGPFAGKR